MSDIFQTFEPEDGTDRHKKPRHVSIKRLIPNILTLIGLCAGLTAIRMAIEGRFEFAITALLFAAVLDGLDGRIARLLRATSRFGAELDSLADFVNFGVAPAIIIFTWALSDLRSAGWIVVLIFVMCTALRLARFNVALDMADEPHWKKNYFVGMPAPAAAVTVMLPLYLYFLEIPGPKWLNFMILIYTLFIALLMVSRVPTFSGKLFGENIQRKYVLPVFVCMILFISLLFTYSYAVLSIATIIYLAAIPVSVLRFRHKVSSDDPAS
jgi:CDP-diacylglycerol--serine O-phosphatidyltransferase